MNPRTTAFEVAELLGNDPAEIAQVARDLDIKPDKDSTVNCVLIAKELNRTGKVIVPITVEL